MTEDEGFLQRWSRRKQSALRNDEVSEDEASQAPEANEEAVSAESLAADASSAELEAGSASEPEPEPPGDEDMPPLESIDESGSVAAFLSPRVSEGLRRAALRRLFSQPKYNVVDMLDDYAEDYSKPVALGSVVTADMRYRAEQAAKRMERKLKESLARQDEAGDSVASVEPEPAAEPETEPNTETPAAASPGTDEQTLADAGDAPVSADDGDDADPDR